MAYWTNIFTLETWAQSQATEFRVSGFPPPTPGRGGYHLSMFERVNRDDVFLCYCKRPAQRWVGALRVTGDCLQSEEPVWGLTADGKVRYPWRFPVEPVVVLDPAYGLLGAESVAQLSFLRRLRQWGTYLQRSLNSVPDDDGARLVTALRQPREPKPIQVPAIRRRAREEKPEPTLLDATAAPAPTEASEAPDEIPEPRVHTEVQAKLRDIGIKEGYDVWVADRGVQWDHEELGTGCLTQFPVVAADRTLRAMRNIDVIWFRKGTGHPVRLFEIEHSTDVYSGLLRFNDVRIDYPITEAFIVGEGDRTKAKFEREIGRRTFEHSGLNKVTRFLSYESVRATWQAYRGIGEGSRHWGEA